MAAEVTIQYAEGIADLTLNGTVKKGDPVAYDGTTGWVQADASDATTNLFAQYIAMQGGVAGNKIKGCKRCVLYDADAPYLANTMHYVSATAGAIVYTRPTADGDVIQVIGHGITTSELAVDIKMPHEEEVFLPVGVFNQMNGGALEGLVQDGTTVAWHGPDVDSAQVAAIFSAWFPSGMIGAPLAADLLVNTQASTALNVDVTYVRAYINSTNVGDAGVAKTELTTSETTADNEIQKVSIVAGMDADFAKAGAPFACLIDPDAGDFLAIGLLMRYQVV